MISTITLQMQLIIEAAVLTNLVYRVLYIDVRL